MFFITMHLFALFVYLLIIYLMSILVRREHTNAFTLKKTLNSKRWKKPNPNSTKRRVKMAYEILISTSQAHACKRKCKCIYYLQHERCKWCGKMHGQFEFVVLAAFCQLFWDPTRKRQRSTKLIALSMIKSKYFWVSTLQSKRCDRQCLFLRCLVFSRFVALHVTSSMETFPSYKWILRIDHFDFRRLTRRIYFICSSIFKSLEHFKSPINTALTCQAACLYLHFGVCWTLPNRNVLYLHWVCVCLSDYAMRIYCLIQNSCSIFV